MVPSSFASPFPRIGIGAINGMAVMVAFPHGVMFDQCAERPALEVSVSGTGSLNGQAALRIALHDVVSNHSTPPVIALTSSGAAGAARYARY
jgi:hypothetical protein